VGGRQRTSIFYDVEEKSESGARKEKGKEKEKQKK